MNIVKKYNLLKKILKQRDIENFALDARILIQYVLKISREDFILKANKQISSADLDILDKLAQRRLQGEPVSKIIGKREFYGLEFQISSETLDPRPDTEILVSTILNNIDFKNDKYEILDLGTGSGCILLSLLHELPNSEGTGIDISKGAIKMAKKNAINLNLSNRLNLINTGWQDFSVQKRYDIIVSNPPYIPTQDIASLSKEVKNFDPNTALDGGVDGLNCYHDLARIIPSFLKEDGMVAIEIGYSQANDVCDIFKRYNFLVKSIEKDLAGYNRCILLEKNNKNK